jgi:uncharacterized membrane protein YfcA
VNQLLAAIIALIALLVRGLTGFGSSLVMMPLLMLFLDTRTAVVAAALTQVPVGLWIALRSRRAIDFPNLKLLLAPSILGIIVGSFILVKFDNDLLRRTFGIITVVFAIRIMLTSSQASTHHTKLPESAGYLAGVAGGILGGIFGISGPPVIMFLERQVNRKDVLRATLLGYFLAIDSLRLCSYALARLVNRQALVMSLVMIPTALIGAYWGTRLNMRTSEHAFRFIVGALLCVTGILLAAR